MIKKSLLAFLVFSFWSTPSTGAADTWMTETVDGPKYFGVSTPRAIAVDSNNHPHMVYGGDCLYYAYHDGSALHYETIDASPGVGGSASIAVDSNNSIHIGYSGGAGNPPEIRNQRLRNLGYSDRGHSIWGECLSGNRHQPSCSYDLHNISYPQVRQ